MRVINSHVNKLVEACIEHEIACDEDVRQVHLMATGLLVASANIAARADALDRILCTSAVFLTSRPGARYLGPSGAF
jgi:hypothetical protein